MKNNAVALVTDAKGKKQIEDTLDTAKYFDYIIVTHPDYMLASRKLAKWKMQLGFKVEIISSSSWNSNDIKDSLFTKYSNYAIKNEGF